jgi:hypothetical protein
MKTITRRGFVSAIALLPSLRFAAAHAQTAVTAAEARAIAKEAYIYGFPDRGQLSHPAHLLVDRERRCS